MAELSIDSIAEIVEARPILADSNTMISELLFDSRRYRRADNCLFFALRGKNHDGHDYIRELIRKGVRNFVLEELPENEYDECNFLIVPNSLDALQKLATSVRQDSKAKIIAITGSNGKTIVKEWLYQVLQSHFTIGRNPKSYNSQVGVPLSVWTLSPLDELGIFEAGISKPGEMEKLQNILQPDWGIFTNIGSAHEENFENRQQKIREKLRLFTSVEKLFYHAQDNLLTEEIKAFAKKNLLKTVCWSEENRQANLCIQKQVVEENTLYLEAVYKDKTLKMKLPFRDASSRENAIHCWLVALEMDLENEEIQKAISHLEPIEMRLEMKAGSNNNLLINDAYNADLESLKIALEFLDSQAHNRPKILILSDILQSGLSSQELYQEVANILKRYSLERIIAIGDKLQNHSLDINIPVDYFTDTETFLHQIFKYRFVGKAILLKGARSFHFEEISRWLEQKTHETVLEIHLHRMVHNLNYFRAKLSPETKIMAMVKAFSYGSGSYEIANLLEFHKVDYLAVAYTDEGIELRKEGIAAPILVLNPEVSSFEAMIEYELEPEIYSFQQLLLFHKALKSTLHSGEPYPIHLKMETGMHRLGFEKEELPQLTAYLTKNPDLKIASVFSHLAASDDPNEKEFTLDQIAALREMADFIQKECDTRFLVHILNSSGISNYPEAHFDMVRLGIGLYGISPDKDEQRHLKVVSELKATVSQIKKLKPGDSVGYGRSFKADREMEIAIISIGYADGLRRSLGNGIGEVIIRGKRHKIVGRVCMDMAMVDISNTQVEEGDEVEIFGPNLSIYEVAEKMETIPYEVLTSISQRVKRVYFME